MNKILNYLAVGAATGSTFQGIVSTEKPENCLLRHCEIDDDCCEGFKCNLTWERCFTQSF